MSYSMFVNFICQFGYIKPCISLISGRNVLKDSCLCYFSAWFQVLSPKKLLCVLPTLLCMFDVASYKHQQILWHPTASTLCLHSFPRKQAQVVSRSYAQNKVQMNHPQRISWLYWWLFRMHTCCVMALGWLKKEEWTILSLTISGLPLWYSYYTLCYYYCRMGQAYKLLFVF